LPRSPTLTVLLVTLATVGVGVAVAIALWLLVRRLVPVVLRAVDRLLTGLHPRVRAALRASVREPNPLHPPTKEHAPMAEPNLAILYSRLGREVGLKKAVEDFYRRVLPDPLLAYYFAQLDETALKHRCWHLIAFLAAATGAPTATPAARCAPPTPISASPARRSTGSPPTCWTR
jgi:hypothetical protein